MLEGRRDVTEAVILPRSQRLARAKQKTASPSPATLFCRPTLLPATHAKDGNDWRQTEGVRQARSSSSHGEERLNNGRAGTKHRSHVPTIHFYFAPCCLPNRHPRPTARSTLTNCHCSHHRHGSLNPDLARPFNNPRRWADLETLQARYGVHGHTCAWIALTVGSPTLITLGPNATRSPSDPR